MKKYTLLVYACLLILLLLLSASEVIWAQENAAESTPKPQEAKASKKAKSLPSATKAELEQTSSGSPEAATPTVKSIEDSVEKSKDEKKEDPSLWDKTKETASNVGDALAAARYNRSKTKWSIIGNYSLFETWISSKMGGTLSYHSDESTLYEFEYMSGSYGFSALGLDIGEVKEQRFSLLMRTYGERNTFNLIWGLYYGKFDVGLGDSLLETVTQDDRAHVELLQIETLGATFGLGNRWQTGGGFIWGFDWFVINWPFYTIKESTDFLDETDDEDTKEDVEKAIGLFKSIPTFAVVKIQLGFSF
jgi:hypothetical protein